MRVSVIGSGYVGPGLWSLLRRRRQRRGCLDVDSRRSTCSTPDRSRSTSRASTSWSPPTRRPDASCSPPTTPSLSPHADVDFIAVGTPPDEDGTADLRHSVGCPQRSASHLTRVIVVDKSTVPVGTADRVAPLIAEEFAGAIRACPSPSRRTPSS